MTDSEMKDFIKTKFTALGTGTPTTVKETELLASSKSFLQSQWNETEFSLYRYTSPNFQYEVVTDAFPSTTPATVDQESQQQEASDRGTGFSLSLIGSSVASDKEHLLREQVATRMSHGSLYCGSGQVTSLDPSIFPQPSQVYYCLLEAVGETESDRSSEDSMVDSGLTSPLRVNSRRQYVVCFSMIGKTGLDLFRTELDSFCTQSITPLLPDKSAEKVMKSFQESSLQSMLGQWYNLRIEYITRVVQLCQKILPILLHTAIDSDIKVTGPNENNVRDVKLFLDTCSMASLMQLEGETKVAPSPLTRKKVTVTASHNTCTLSSEESSQFCSNWAQVLLAHGAFSPDPFFLRQAVENYKLKIVQDLNAFKRLLREAESDYHALYRCYLFLSACGNGKLLLQCVLQEATSLQVTPTLAVLDVLHTFSTKNGFRKLNK